MQRAQGGGASGTAGRPRDPRLDLARGLAMIVILIAHIPGNRWALWIPARFGPSDAADLFVLCSGLAAALAFGGTYARAGWWLGTARVGLRIWQIWWAHLGLFLATVTLVLLAQAHLAPAGRDWPEELGLAPLLADPGRALVGIVTLGWIPPYLDILPMYMVALALMPLVMALAALDRRLVLVPVVGLYLAAQAGANLPASPWDAAAGWGFNPLAWQLLFFTGFAFGRGWLVVPHSPWLVRLAAAWVVLWIPLAHWAIVPLAEPLQAFYARLLAPAAFKTDLHPVRILHLLALACLALALLERRPTILEQAWTRPVLAIGRRALATFLASMLLARLLGFALDLTDRGPLVEAAANLVGILGLVAVARAVAWLDAAPFERAGPGPRQPLPGARPAVAPPRTADDLALEAQRGG